MPFFIETAPSTPDPNGDLFTNLSRLDHDRI
jgi:hypothetical protein